MKILQVLTQMEAGGAQKIALILNKYLAMQGHEIETNFLYIKRPVFIEEKNISWCLEKKPEGLLEYLNLIFIFLSKLKKEKPDIILAHTHTSIIFCAIATFFRKNIIAVHHSPIYSYSRKSYLAIKILNYLGTYKGHIAVSKNVLNSITNNQIKEKSIIIKNGIEIQANVDQKNQKTISLISIGRLSEVKNQAFILKVIKKIPNVDLVIIGDGENREMLEKQILELNIESQVKILGELPYEDVLENLSRAKIFLMPSLYESVCLALLEAMSMGCAVIANDIPASHEFLGKAGIILPLDEERWVNTIQELLDNNKLLESLSHDALLASRQFTAETMAENYHKFLTSLA